MTRTRSRTLVLYGHQTHALGLAYATSWTDLHKKEGENGKKKRGKGGK